MLPLNFFLSKKFLRLFKFFPIKISLVPVFCANFEATGSNGTFKPGLHLSPTIFLKPSQSIFLIIFVFLCFLGSLSCK